MACLHVLYKCTLKSLPLVSVQVKWEEIILHLPQQGVVTIDDLHVCEII